MSCNLKHNSEKANILNDPKPIISQYLTVLGVAQDAGFPQINCDKSCCKAFYDGNEPKQLVSSLGLIDLEAKKKWIFDATPDFVEQTQILKSNHLNNGRIIDGIFLTHAHIGHYTGLMYLGREALGANQIPVYTMPRLKTFLTTNGPWSQLVQLKNISIHQMSSDSTIKLSNSIKVIPLLVPHRDEFSETVGYKISGNSKTALFIPDIDKWQLWNFNIIDEVRKVDYAFLDASFFSNGELDRDMSEIPHPFITETTTLFEKESDSIKNKIYFIHFNHTNSAIKASHHLKDSIQKLGFNFAKQGDNFEL